MKSSYLFANNLVRTSCVSSGILVAFTILLLPTIANSNPAPSQRASAGTQIERLMSPVRLRIAGREIHMQVSAISDGKAVYVPLEAFKSVNTMVKINAARDGVIITPSSGQAAEVDYIRHGGKTMVNLADAAEILDAKVVGPVVQTTSDSRTVKTVYLLARITGIRVINNALRVTTSFKVPIKSQNLPDGQLTKGFVDCSGAFVDQSFRPSPVSLNSQNRMVNLRVAQNSPEVVRIVVGLTGGSALQTGVYISSAPPTYSVPLVLAHRSTQNPDSQLPSSDQVPNSIGKRNPRIRVIPSNRANSTNGDNSLPPAIRPPLSQIKRIAEIRSILINSDDENTFQIVLRTNRKIKAMLNHSQNGRQIIIEIPSAQLNLTDERQSEQRLDSDLISRLSAETVQVSSKTPPVIRIILSTPRQVSISTESSDTEYIIELTVSNIRDTNNAIQ